MKLSLFARAALATLASLALGLGMTACGGGTIGYLWVLGQQYNQIAGFKVDDYTGNLTAIPGAPFGSGGSVPVAIQVKLGGRYVYVLNQGTGGSKSGAGSSSGIAVFAVGGDGTLTYQATYHSQGYVPVWMQFDSTGGFLYVLDKYSPSGDGNGSVTAFSVDSNTGRLSLVTNSQTQVNNLNTYYFEVGVNPLMMKTIGSCLYTVNSGDQSISPYSISPSTGQLAFVTTQKIPTSAVNITSINGSGSYVYLTDSTGSSSQGRVFPFTIGSNCALNLNSGGVVTLPANTANPVYSMVDRNTKYLYVLNQSTTTTTVTTPYSSISAYSINTSNGQLQPITTSSPTVGSGPVCMVEDTSNQYIYVSNHNDGTVTGKVIDPNTGNLSDLSRGSTFTATGQASCLELSGQVI